MVLVRPIATGEPGEHRIVLFRHYPGKVFLAVARDEGRIGPATYGCRGDSEGCDRPDEEDVTSQLFDDEWLLYCISRRCPSPDVAIETLHGRDLSEGLDGEVTRWMVAKFSRPAADAPFVESGRLEIARYATDPDEGELRAQLRTRDVDGDGVEEASVVLTMNDPLLAEQRMRATFLVDGKTFTPQAALLHWTGAVAIQNEPEFGNLSGAYRIDETTHELEYRLIRAADPEPELTTQSEPLVDRFIERRIRCPYDAARDRWTCAPAVRVAGHDLFTEAWAAVLPTVEVPMRADGPSPAPEPEGAGTVEPTDTAGPVEPGEAAAPTPTPTEADAPSPEPSPTPTEAPAGH